MLRLPYKKEPSAQDAQRYYSLNRVALVYAHLPCIAHNAFIGWNKDFFGMLSGAVIGVYSEDRKGGHWTCTGALTLDKAHLRSNLLSSQVQKDLLQNSSALAKNIELDLHFSTKSPLQVKTFFFNTNTEINASVKGTVAHPLVTGLIELNKGSFIFPYKPLYVSMGKLYLTPDQPDDPANTVGCKKYGEKIYNYHAGIGNSPSAKNYFRVFSVVCLKSILLLFFYQARKMVHCM